VSLSCVAGSITSGATANKGHQQRSKLWVKLCGVRVAGFARAPTPGAVSRDVNPMASSSTYLPIPTATLCMPGFPPSPRVRSCRKACITLPTLPTTLELSPYLPYLRLPTYGIFRMMSGCRVETRVRCRWRWCGRSGGRCPARAAEKSLVCCMAASSCYSMQALCPCLAPAGARAPGGRG
jgi:hypothetical protein